MGQLNRSEEKRQEASSSILAPVFMFLLLPQSLPYVNWASQEGCLLHLGFSLWSSPSFVLFSQAFSFLCLLATAILDSFFLF